MSSPRHSSRSNGRKPRLPKHLNLDYILIPAPEDLSLLTATEKSPLPAIIVTPSSPSSTKDFSIAFLAPPKKPSFRERISGYLGSKSPTSPPPPGYTSPPITTSQNAPSVWRDTWRGWMSSINPPIALPITSPVSASAPRSWHYDAPPPSKRRTPTRFMIFASVVFLLVFCHVLTHYIASSAVGFKGTLGGDSGVDMGEGSTSGAGAGYGQSWMSKLDWQGWFNFQHSRAALKHSGAAFVADLPVDRVVKPTSIPAVLRSAIARNEV